jgi:hypothetical protein
MGFARENPDAVKAAVASTAEWAYKNPDAAASMHSAWQQGKVGGRNVQKPTRESIDLLIISCFLR